MNEAHATNESNSERWKMFVEEPSSFGIENTFRYMCDRIRMANKKKIMLSRLGRDKKDKEEEENKQK